MPLARDPKPGKRLHVKGRTLPFSMWPVGRGIRRYGLSDYLFAKSQWAVVHGAVEAHTDESRRPEATAFLDQARSFFEAANDRTVAATPLLLYYAFLNLAKAFILASGFEGSLDQAMHGLKDSPGPAGEIEGASVVVKKGGTSIFPLYASALELPVPTNNATYSVTELMAQVVVGHRLWREAGKKERFVDLKEIGFFHDVSEGPGHAWLRLHISRGDLNRFDITQKRLVAEGQLSGKFERIKNPDPDQLWFEQLKPTAYGHRAADVLKDVVRSVRPLLWRIATSMPPYRHYYVHLTPPNKASERLPQLLSLYMLFFYFGSVTRYRPHVFEQIVSGAYGPFVQEFMASQADQLLYLLATEICQREVAKPALI
jgi:hypothetical protein